MTKSDVLEHFGTPEAVAEALGISRHAFYQWGEQIPRGRAFEIEVITGGALKARGERVKKDAA